jgi:hypothetical protein
MFVNSNDGNYVQVWAKQARLTEFTDARIIWHAPLLINVMDHRGLSFEQEIWVLDGHPWTRNTLMLKARRVSICRGIQLIMIIELWM